MPRSYKPTGSRQYRKHDEALIDLALQEYNSTKIPLSRLSKKYNIPKTVLHRHNTFITKKQGGQNALRLEEEEYLIKYINICSEWGYPLETLDLRCLIKGYLDQLGLTVRRFKNNMPGPDYVKCFLKRHRDKITTRLSQNIKRSRAEVSPEIIDNYFRELEMSLEGVPLSNIVNYDETNLTDDPGRKKVLVRRSVKYPERIMNHTKGSTSIMMAAAADGTFLPPYVVYKAQYVYDTWRLNGPKGGRYNSTPSGWFDAVCFEDWVKTIIIPYFNNKLGTKILIGDNLSSHLSIQLIRDCKATYDIRFIFLPANSTHLTQPLDVAIFRPLKIKWRDILFNWKKHDGSNYATVPKQCFPMLLNKLMSALKENISQNIKSGFHKCGISPLNKNKVLERIPNLNPNKNDDYKEAIDGKVLTLLQEMRYGISGRTTIPNRKKKIDVVPGRSVENLEIEESNESNTEEVPVYKKDIIVRAGTSKEIERKNKSDMNICMKKNKTITKQIDDGQLNSKLLTTDKHIEFGTIKGKKTNNVKLIKKTKRKEENDNDKTRENLDPPIFKKPYLKFISPLIVKTTTRDGNTAKTEEEKENYIKEIKTQAFIDEMQKDQEETLINNLPPFNDIFNMPIVFEDMFLVTDSIEVVTDNNAVMLEDNQDTNNSFKSNPVRNVKTSKIKILSEKNISDRDIKKIESKINTGRKPKILKVTDRLRIKRPKYYKNESEILSDLTDEDVI